MPKVVIYCTLCRHGFQGEDAYQQAMACESQGKPSFKYSTGQVGRYRIIARRVGYQAGKHIPEYRVRDQPHIWPYFVLEGTIDREVQGNPEITSGHHP